MPKNEFYVLPEDRAAALARIAELDKAILDMGPDFYIALNQSSETWHDNAPFDALRDEQALLEAERQKLKQVIVQAMRPPTPRKGKVNIGSMVTLQTAAGKTSQYLLAGHWSYRLSQKVNGALVITCTSPIGQAMLGKKVGQSFSYGPKALQAVITDIV